MKLIPLLLTLLLFGADQLFAATPSSIFSDGMVLQRNKPIKIWGTAEAGEHVHVTMNMRRAHTRADKDGYWKVTLPEMEAGGPHIIEIRGGRVKSEIRDVLMGDVWICSGQSNIEWMIEKFPYANDEARAAAHPNLRMFTVPRTPALKARKHLTGGKWQKAEGNNVMKFSAVAYFFGLNLQRRLDVPIGLIVTAWGGTNIEAWTPRDVLDEYINLPELQEQIDVPKETEQQWIDKHLHTGAGLRERWYDADFNALYWKPVDVPATFGKIAGNDFKGVIWFKKTFDLPTQFRGQNLDLRLGKIQTHDMVWVNGRLLGETLGQSKWRSYLIPYDLLRPENNIITIRVLSNTPEGGINDNADNLNFFRQGNSYGFQMLSGKWHYRIDERLEYELIIPQFESTSLAPNNNPGSLFNGMLHPLIPLPITGFIWYQGEANTVRAEEYGLLFPAMIKEWRERFDQGNLPFLFVQLANYKAAKDTPEESERAELREAQNTALQLPNTGAAIAIDLGEADNIHPKNKQEVGRRLALSAFKVAYGIDTVHSGPVLQQTKKAGNTLILTFDPGATSLMLKDRYGYIKGFAIASEEGPFEMAKGALDGNNVILWSDKVTNPAYVRYAWADNPDDANLYNDKGFPASPFRTDSRPGITAGKTYAPAE